MKKKNTQNKKNAYNNQNQTRNRQKHRNKNYAIFTNYNNINDKMNEIDVKLFRVECGVSVRWPDESIRLNCKQITSIRVARKPISATL